MFVLPVEVMLAGRSLRLKARKRRLVRVIEDMVTQAEAITKTAEKRMSCG